MSAPALDDYRLAHPIPRRNAPGQYGFDLERDCVRLILFNVQSMTVPEIWTELTASLGELARSIVKVKRVSGPNRNPHADLWVRKDSGTALVDVVRRQTRTRLWDYSRIVTELERKQVTMFVALRRRGDEHRSPKVTNWRITFWSSWRERRFEPPAKDLPKNNEPRPNLTNLATWNINGFWSKQIQVEDFLQREMIAAVYLQETLVKDIHYPARMSGYRCYQRAAEEDFRGTAMLVDNRLASYEVTHGLSWMTHVKVFGYAGVSGPTHLIGVYFKSGGNHRTTRLDAVREVVKVVTGIANKNPEDRVVVMGDFNINRKGIEYYLEKVHALNVLDIAFIVGSSLTRFPINGPPRELDHFLLNGPAVPAFRPGRVLRSYNASDHRPLVIRPRHQLLPTRDEKPKVKFDNKMLRLKSDLIINDNSWTKLMTRAFGPDYAAQVTLEEEEKRLVSDNANSFFDTFDQVCRKHSVKKDRQPSSKRRFPRKLKCLLKTVKKYSKKVTHFRGQAPKEIDLTRLAHAQRRFKTAKREWEIRLKHQHYAQVTDDFVSHDHKGVWDRLRPQVRPGSESTGINPVKDKDGILQYRAEDILAAMKEHYEDLLTYDPQNVSQNFAHWDGMDFGVPKPEMVGLDHDLLWPEILNTIRGMNRNTAVGKDAIHINVLKAMVLEESMAQIKEENPAFRRPDNVRIDLPYKELPQEPLTPMGKVFYVLLQKTWRTGCIPDKWNEVQIVNLFKGGDPESTNNYRGISLISCAFKVLMAVMASRLSLECLENDVLVPEQGGFRLREEAVAQATALAEIVRRRWMKGKPTYGLFIDFKKAYDRLYHGLLFRVLHHIGCRGRFLNMVKAMYMETKYEVRVGGFTSESFSPVRGAKQGDPLSPILFIISINQVLRESSATGGVRLAPSDRRCAGLMYADDVVALESKLKDVQETLVNVWNWGQKFGMDLGRDKCGVILWPSAKPRDLRRRALAVLDLESDSEHSSIEGVDPWNGDMFDLIDQHDQHDYTMPEGIIPTVQHYKYLGITLDTRLGDPRRIVTGERSMELEFAHLQAKKGIKVLHALRPFLTDRFCPIQLKVLIVRNLLYSKMLYGAELIGFQQLHAEPMQRVINTAAKWILGLSSANTQTDAFSLCFELGLPPVHQELCAMRARLCFKLDSHRDGGLSTWIQHLWDNPPEVILNGSQSWVTASKKWIRGLEKDRHKYDRLITESAPGRMYLTYGTRTVPLRPWAQLGKTFEMKVRSTAYNRDQTTIQAHLRTAFLGETEMGTLSPVDEEAPFGALLAGIFVDTEFDTAAERDRMDLGRPVPPGRDRGEVVKTAFVRDVVLERLMSSQKTKGFQWYDRFYFGITRGYLREAANRPDLAEGVRWLSLARCHGYPTVEGAWQRIKRSGKTPRFERGKCPLCSSAIDQGWEWSHLLTSCTHPKVAELRDVQLGDRITRLQGEVFATGQVYREAFLELVGRERQTIATHYDAGLGVISILLIGGWFRPQGMEDPAFWFHTYLVGFGHSRLLTPGLDGFGYICAAQFLQVISPLYVSALGGDLYGTRSLDGSSLASSRAGSVNLDHVWHTEGWDPVPDEERSCSPEMGDPLAA